MITELPALCQDTIRGFLVDSYFAEEKNERTRLVKAARDAAALAAVGNALCGEWSDLVYDGVVDPGSAAVKARALRRNRECREDWQRQLRERDAVDGLIRCAMNANCDGKTLRQIAIELLGARHRGGRSKAKLRSDVDKFARDRETRLAVFRDELQNTPALSSRRCAVRWSARMKVALAAAPDTWLSARSAYKKHRVTDLGQYEEDFDAEFRISPGPRKSCVVEWTEWYVCAKKDDVQKTKDGHDKKKGLRDPVHEALWRDADSAQATLDAQAEEQRLRRREDAGEKRRQTRDRTLRIALLEHGVSEEDVAAVPGGAMVVHAFLAYRRNTLPAVQSCLAWARDIAGRRRRWLSLLSDEKTQHAGTPYDILFRVPDVRDFIVRGTRDPTEVAQNWHEIRFILSTGCIFVVPKHDDVTLTGKLMRLSHRTRKAVVCRWIQQRSQERDGDVDALIPDIPDTLRSTCMRSIAVTYACQRTNTLYMLPLHHGGTDVGPRTADQLITAVAFADAIGAFAEAVASKSVTPGSSKTSRLQESDLNAFCDAYDARRRRDRGLMSLESIRRTQQTTRQTQSTRGTERAPPFSMNEENVVLCVAAYLLCPDLRKRTDREVVIGAGERGMTVDERALWNATTNAASREEDSRDAAVDDRKGEERTKVEDLLQTPRLLGKVDKMVSRLRYFTQ